MLGLAKQVTTPTDPPTEVKSQATITGGVSISHRLREMNRTRRVRRMRRVVIAAADAAGRYLDQHGVRCHKAFATLTYRPGVKWAAEHIADYIAACKRHAARRGFEFRYQWVLELTKKGVPHYHVLFWLPLRARMPKPDHGSWVHGRSNIKGARNPVGYIVKYATKGTTALLPIPKGARLFGTGGGCDWERLVSHRAGLPMWLDASLSSFCRARKVARVGWVNRSTGEVHQSPFHVSWSKDDWGVVVVKVTEIGVLHGFESSYRRFDGSEPEYQREGWRELPGEIADRDFASWSVRLSDEYSAWQ